VDVICDKIMGHEFTPGVNTSTARGVRAKIPSRDSFGRLAALRPFGINEPTKDEELGWSLLRHPFVVAAEHNATASPLLRLPMELVVQIMLQLDEVEVFCLRRTCRAFLRPFCDQTFAEFHDDGFFASHSPHTSQRIPSGRAWIKVSELLNKHNLCDRCHIRNQPFDGRPSDNECLQGRYPRSAKIVLAGLCNHGLILPGASHRLVALCRQATYCR
jgi:hypothetical protein